MKKKQRMYIILIILANLISVLLVYMELFAK